MIWFFCVGHVPTLNVCLDILDHVESYAISMLLACRLKITFTSSLKLIISLLVSTYYYLLPSLDSHSSPVRGSTLLFLFSLCCISGLGPRGLLHNCTIPGRNLVISVGIARTPPYAQLPTDALQKPEFVLVHKWWISQETRLVQVMDPMYLFLQGSHKQKQYEERTSLCTWGVRQRVLQVSQPGYSALMWSHEHKPQEPWRMQKNDAEWSAPTNMHHIHSASVPLEMTVFWRYDVLGTDFETHAIWQGYVEEPTAKNFVAKKAHTIALSKTQGTHWKVIKCKLCLGIIQKLS